jgi:TPR repeat protein
MNNNYTDTEELALAHSVSYMPKVMQRLWYSIRDGTNIRQNEFMIGYHFDVGIKATDTSVALIPDTDNAIKWYTRAANKNHPHAQMNLGILFETGRNYSAAVKWYYRAAVSDHTGAMFGLGRMLWKGAGINANYHLAFAFFMKAALKGCVMAQTNVGGMYMYGNGVEQNTAEAHRWLNMAAASGDAVAHHNLGVMYENGIGGYTNMLKAQLHFATALDPRNTNAVSPELSARLRLSRDPLVFT